jgi:hypothetical protein
MADLSKTLISTSFAIQKGEKTFCLDGWMTGPRVHTLPDIIHPLKKAESIRTARGRDNKVLGRVSGRGNGGDSVLVALEGGTQDNLNVRG